MAVAGFSHRQTYNKTERGIETAMTGSESWKHFFDRHAPKYMENVFTKGTEGEVAFLLDLFQLPQGSRILDVGCGTGRHSVGLAAHGYDMTGLDLSDGMLAEAQKAADAAGVSVNWMQGDATEMTFDGDFDAAICLCEGSLGLISEGEDPFEHDCRVLGGIRRALKPGARAVVNCLNGIKKFRQFTPEDVKAGKFDPMTTVERFDLEYEDQGEKRVFNSRERGYVPSEFRLLLVHVGFEVEHIWGGEAGKWGRRPVELDEYELMAVARRPE
ncbi:methyltransferase domain-containing protein [candidate division GN15 bacterium]|nr:methyltransferase domain-containing protein [candidate division GN15 bacterium]